MTLPDVTRLDGWQARLAGAVMGAAAGADDAFQRARRGAREAGVTVAIGPAVGLGLGVVGDGGVGVAFDGRDMGVYGALGAGLGVSYGVSFTLQISVVKGRLDTLGGTAQAIVLGGGPGLMYGVVAALFNPDDPRDLIGMSVGGGVHAGFPVELYYGLQRTWALARIRRA